MKEQCDIDDLLPSTALRRRCKTEEVAEQSAALKRLLFRVTDRLRSQNYSDQGLIRDLQSVRLTNFDVQLALQ